MSLQRLVYRLYSPTRRCLSQEGMVFNIKKDCSVQGITKLQREKYMNDAIALYTLDALESSEMAMTLMREYIDGKCEISGARNCIIQHYKMGFDEQSAYPCRLMAGVCYTQKHTILMFYFDELKITDIAEIMDVSENTVKSYLNYGRKKLETTLGGKKSKHMLSVAPFPLLLLILKESARENVMTQAQSKAVLSVVSNATGVYLNILIKLIIGSPEMKTQIVVKCPKCGSEHVVRNGKKPNGKQLYKCRDCNRQFIADRISNG